MTISFPNAVIVNTFPVQTVKFALTLRQSVSRQANGMPIGVDFGLPIWTASFTTPPMRHAMCVEMEALLNSLDGMVNPIWVRDTRREYPAAYPAGGFADSGSITTWGASGKSVSLSGLPANFALSRGDYFSYALSGKRYLHQVMESIAASAAGATGDFEIRPHYPTGAGGTVAVSFATPIMNFIVDPGTIAFADAESLLGTVSFAGFQTF